MKIQKTRRGIVGRTMLGSAVLLAAVAAMGGDWPQFRGPNHDGVSTDPIVTDWTGSATNPVWMVQITNSLSGFAVSGGRAFTLVTRSNPSATNEVCVALNAANGKELWETPVDRGYFPQYPDVFVGPDDGPRPTPSIVGGAVYVITSFLTVLRLDATNGAILWQTNLLAGFGGTLIRYQNAASPLVDGGLIFVNANSPENSLMAISTTNGAVVWRSQNESMTHSTPVIATIQGVRQVVFATGGGLLGLDPQTGAKLWKFGYPFAFTSHYSLAVSPVVDQDMVFMSGTRSVGYGSVVARVTFTNGTWTTSQLWFSSDPSTTFTTPVVRDGFLYGTFGYDSTSPLNSLRCVNMRTGAVQWAAPGFGRGGILLVDNKLLALTETNMLVLAELNTNAYVELGRFLALPPYNSSTNKSFNVPAVADGRVYVRSTSFGAAYDFSVPITNRPSLTLDPPLHVPPSTVDLTIRTADGSPIDSNRLSALEVRAATNLAVSPGVWPALTNRSLLDGGVVHVTNVDATAPARFFIIREPK